MKYLIYMNSINYNYLLYKFKKRTKDLSTEHMIINLDYREAAMQFLIKIILFNNYSRSIK